MRISSLIFSGMLALVIISIGTASGLLSAYQDRRNAEMREHFATAVVAAAFQLTSLTGNYLLYRENRARVQWGRRHDSLGKLLREPGYQGAATDPEIVQLGRKYTAAGDLFVQINESFTETRRRGDGAGANVVREKRLVDTLLTVTQAMVSQASLLSARSRRALDESDKQISWLMSGFILVLTVLLLGLWRLLAKRVVTPIEELKKGIDTFGRGELDHRLQPRRADEIGEVASAFNEMAEKLQESIASRERAVVSKTRFLAAASHDLRQPMQAITSLTFILKNKLKDKEIAPLVVRLDRNTNVVMDLLNELLDISKLDAGVVEPNVEAVIVNDLFRNAEQSFAPQALEKGIDFRVVPSSAVVCGDAIFLGRIVQNLVANAVRYTDEGKILIGCRRKGENIRIDVCDTGMGIPQTHLKEIFEEFYQVGNPARDRREGMGLGLAIVQRLVKLMNYSLEVSSEQGKGTRFSVLIPLGRLPPEPADNASREVVS